MEEHHQPNQMQTQPKQTTDVANFSKMETAITDVVTAILATTFDVMTPKGLTQAREVRAQIKAMRINLGKAGKTKKAELNTEKRRIDTEVVRLTELALTGEGPLHKLIKDREEVLAEEKRVRDEKERARKVKIQEHITILAETSRRAQRHPSLDIEVMLSAVVNYVITDFFQEFTEQATSARHQAIIELTELLDNTRIREELEREREAEKLRLEEQRREQDERQARQDAEQAEIDRQKAASIPEEKQEEEPEPTGKPIQELADTVVENTLTDEPEIPAPRTPDSPAQDKQPEWAPAVRRLKKTVLQDILGFCDPDDPRIPHTRLDCIRQICEANLNGKK